jgi:hypothetical protein
MALLIPERHSQQKRLTCHQPASSGRIPPPAGADPGNMPLPEDFGSIRTNYTNSTGLHIPNHGTVAAMQQ